MFKSGIMKIDTSNPLMRKIFLLIMLAMIIAIAFELGRIYQIETLLRPKPTDSIIDGTCREILKYDMEQDNETASS